MEQAGDPLWSNYRTMATLFSGDHVMGWATSVVGPPDGSMRDYLASLGRLLTRSGDERYRPTHGPEIDDPHAYVRAAWRVRN